MAGENTSYEKFDFGIEDSDIGVGSKDILDGLGDEVTLDADELEDYDEEEEKKKKEKKLALEKEARRKALLKYKEGKNKDEEESV
jgi:hypothetical protein